jgi:hypothetical protein
MVDDFGFRVTSVRWMSEISHADTIVRPAGRFLVVRLQVANHAKRVDYRFSPDQILIDGPQPGSYGHSAPGQTALDAGQPFSMTIAPGSMLERDFVFDVPPTASDLRLRIRFGARFGEIIDWVIRGDRWIPLHPVP